MPSTLALDNTNFSTHIQAVTTQFPEVTEVVGDMLSKENLTVLLSMLSTSFPQLESLTLSGSLTGDHFTKLSESDVVAKLVKLDLTFEGQETGRYVDILLNSDKFQSNSVLKSLGLHTDYEVTDRIKGLANLSTAKFLSNLEELNLRESGLRIDELVVIATNASHFANLQKLNLDLCFGPDDPSESLIGPCPAVSTVGKATDVVANSPHLQGIKDVTIQPYLG